MLLRIIAISYIIAINIFGFRIVAIQKSDRKANGNPISKTLATLDSPPRKKEHAEKHSEDKPEEIPAEEIKIQKDTQSKVEKTQNPENKKSKNTATPPPNGKQLKKEDIFASEKLNFKKYELISDIKILLVGVFGGAMGEYIAFLIFKYRTTNTILMVVLPVFVAVWIYLLYIFTIGIVVI